MSAVNEPVYPASVRISTVVTIMNDRDLVELVRAGCGEDMAALLENRLAAAEPHPMKNFVEQIRSALSDIESGLQDMDSIMDQIEE